MSYQSKERDQLEQINCRIVEAEVRIMAQQNLIARLQEKGWNPERSQRMLALMIDALEHMKVHRRQILHALAGQGRNAARSDPAGRACDLPDGS